jgi:HAD superfamily phosphoserine phosphatase-like hydrolase
LGYNRNDHAPRTVLTEEPILGENVTMPHAVLISDFDGTMTANDFYKLAAERLLPPDALTPWEDYRAGSITHFEALRRIFGRLRASPEALQAILSDMRPDPDLAASLARLRTSGWEVVVASAGCDWYIRRILAEAGVTVEVHANPGVHVLPEGSLRMDFPEDSPFQCLETGVDKAGIVRFHRDGGALVAFAGDGLADLPAALETPAAMRFARADLALALSQAGEFFRPFNRWAEVADALVMNPAKAATEGPV